MVSEVTEKRLWEVKFPDECKQLPLDYLEDDEKILAEKCMNREELTEEEKKKLKKLLQSYRPYFKDYNGDAVEKNIESSKKVIKTQSELLRLVHDESRYRIDMNYYLNGEKYLLQMKIKPYTDKQYLEGVGTQVGLFRDLPVDERKLISKAEAKQPMTHEETKMYNALMDKLNDKVYTMEFNLKIINEFLADRLTFIDDENTTFEERLKFWEEIDINTKTSLFHEVRGRLRLTDTFEEDLFPSIR